MYIHACNSARVLREHRTSCVSCRYLRANGPQIAIACVPWCYAAFDACDNCSSDVLPSWVQRRQKHRSNYGLLNSWGVDRCARLLGGFESDLWATERNSHTRAVGLMFDDDDDDHDDAMTLEALLNDVMMLTHESHDELYASREKRFISRATSKPEHWKWSHNSRKKRKKIKHQ